MPVIRRIRTEFGEIQVRRDGKTGAMIYWQGAYHQSESDGRGVSLSTYIHALYGLILQRPCKKILMIGCAAGVLGTMLHKAGIAVTIVDINAQAFDIARQYFGLPPEVTCVVDDGYAFLRKNEAVYDVIVLDAYDGNTMPAQFMRPAFARLARSRLHKTRGRLLTNAYVVFGVDQWEDKVARLFSTAFPSVRILDEPGDNNRNVIVMAGAVSRLTCPALLQPPAFEGKRLAAELAEMAFRHVERRASR